MGGDSVEESSITRVPGVRCASGVLGIKANGQSDAALFVVDHPAAYAGVFTTNQFKSACVESAAERLHAGKQVQAVLITSGNANAGTGLNGRADTELLADAVALQIGCHADEVVVLHTGVIGIALHAERLTPHIAQLVHSLSDEAAAGIDAARAMMTTDTMPKMALRTVTVDGKTRFIAGVAKGAGMIHPRLATMLSVIITDVAVHPSALQAALTKAVSTSFNAISVDGDTSPNDSVILLATGQASPLTQTDDAYAGFCDALEEVASELAQMIVKDGEGATKFIEIEVKGAASLEDAKTIAATVATSPLVKTAFYGEDFNPGRIISAVGRSGVAVPWDSLTLQIGSKVVFSTGEFQKVSPLDAKSVMAQKEIVVSIDLATGNAQCRFFTCDLTHDYVSINAEYTT